MENDEEIEPFEYDFSSFNIDEHVNRMIAIAEDLLNDVVLISKSMEELEKEEIVSPQELEYYKTIRKLSEDQKKNLIYSLNNFYQFKLINLIESINDEYVTIKDAHMSVLEIIDVYTILLHFLVTNEFHSMWDIGSKLEEFIKEEDEEIDIDVYKVISYFKAYRSDVTLEVNGEQITEQMVVNANIYLMIQNAVKKLSMYIILAKLILVAQHRKKKINWKSIIKKIIPVLNTLKSMQ